MNYLCIVLSTLLHTVASASTPSSWSNQIFSKTSNTLTALTALTAHLNKHSSALNTFDHDGQTLLTAAIALPATNLRHTATLRILQHQDQSDDPHHSTALVNTTHPVSHQTPLHQAVRLGDEIVVRMLLDFQADTQVRDNDGYLAIDYAKGMWFDDHPSMVEAFKAHQVWAGIEQRSWLATMNNMDVHCGDVVSCERTKVYTLGWSSATRKSFVVVDHRENSEELGVFVPVDPHAITNQELVHQVFYIDRKLCTREPMTAKPGYPLYKRLRPTKLPSYTTSYSKAMVDLSTSKHFTATTTMPQRLHPRDVIHWSSMKGYIVRREAEGAQRDAEETPATLYTILVDDSKHFEIKQHVPRSQITEILEKSAANNFDNATNHYFFSVQNNDEAVQFTVRMFCIYLLAWVGAHIYWRCVGPYMYMRNSLMCCSGSMCCAGICLKKCCPHFLFNVFYFPFRCILSIFLFPLWMGEVVLGCIAKPLFQMVYLPVSLYHYTTSTTQQFGQDLIFSFKEGIVETIRGEFLQHCAASSVTSSTSSTVSLLRSVVKIVAAAVREPPILIVCIAMGLAGWFVSPQLCINVLGAFQTIIVVIVGCFLVFRNFYSFNETSVAPTAAAASSTTLFWLFFLGPFGYLLYAKHSTSCMSVVVKQRIKLQHYFRHRQSPGFTFLRRYNSTVQNIVPTAILFVFMVGEYLLRFLCNASFFWVVPRSRIRMARSAWAGWATVGLLYVVSMHLDVNSDGGIDAMELMTGFGTLTVTGGGRGGRGDDSNSEQGPWHLAFGLIAFVTVTAWTVQVVISEQVNQWRQVEHRVEQKQHELSAEKKNWTLLRQVSNDRRSTEKEKHMAQIRAMKGLECAHCHNNVATSINMDCGHCILCSECTATYRARQGPKCPVPDCNKKSTIKEMAPTLTTCFICYQGWESSCIFRPTSGGSECESSGETKGQSTVDDGRCDHLICVACMVDSVRLALREKSMFHTFENKQGLVSGLKCPMYASGCRAIVFEQDISRLRSVSARVLPDSRSDNGTLPLTIEENNKFKRFIYEARIPVVQRLYCINRKCMDHAGFRRLNDMAQDMTQKPPSLFKCHWCATKMCTKCKRPWHPNTMDCAKASQEKESVTQRNISATTKPCPKCNFRVSHWHGHACHHISPSTRGCPSCHTHWCYSCGTAGKKSPGYCNSSPKCRLNCVSTDVVNHLSTVTGWPTDQRCGCAVCPTCRPGKKCATCNGSCVVCKGIVPPGTFVDPNGGDEEGGYHSDYLPSLNSLGAVKQEKKRKQKWGWF